MNLSVILEKKPGHIVPSEMIEHLIKLRGSASGFAIRYKDDDTNKNALTYEFAKTSQPAAQYAKIVQAAKDNSLVMFFTNKAGKFDDGKDVQPFVLVNGEGDDAEAFLAVFIEGDFSKYSGGERSDEGNLYEQFVQPLLIEKASESKSLDEFYDKLRSKTFQQSLINAANHRCVFCFVPLNGEIIAFGDNQLAGQYEWGNVSDNLDFGVPKEEKHPIKDAVVATGKAARRFFLNDGDSPAPEPVQPDPAKHAPAVAPPPITDPKTDTAIPAGSVWVHPPKDCERSVMNAWYRAFNKNQLPKNHEKRPPILIAAHLVELAQRPIKTSGELKQLLKDLKDKGTIIKEPKDMRQPETKVVDQVGGTTIKEVANNDTVTNVSDYIPSMNKDEVGKVSELALKFMSGDADKRPTLVDLQKREEAWPKFSAAVGVPLVDTMYWTPDQLMQLDKKALVQLLNEFKMSFRQTDTYRTFIETETQKRVEAAKAVHTAAKEELAPPPKVAAGGTRRFFS
jgi:hypothetical protein